MSRLMLGSNHPDFGAGALEATAPEATRRRGGYAHRIRTLVVLPQSKPVVSFAPADQQVKFCAHCWRLFRTVNTAQRFCNLLCASGGSHAGDA